MIRSFLALAVALTTLPALAATAPPAVTHFTLSNGLEYTICF